MMIAAVAGAANVIAAAVAASAMIFITRILPVLGRNSPKRMDSLRGVEFQESKKILNSSVWHRQQRPSQA
jgi:hypothetical protein